MFCGAGLRPAPLLISKIICLLTSHVSRESSRSGNLLLGVPELEMNTFIERGVERNRDVTGGPSRCQNLRPGAAEILVIFICMFLWNCVYSYSCSYSYTYICIYTCYTCIYIYIYICVCVYVYVIFIEACMCLYLYVYPRSHLDVCLLCLVMLVFIFMCVAVYM